MKRFCVGVMLLIAVNLFAQNPQQLITIPIGVGSSVQGWIYLPADYNTSTKKYPVVFFYHGIGEAGTDPNLLLNQGIPQLIAGGMRPDNITNPVDGLQYSFIVVSAQHWNWSPSPDWLPYQVDWLKANYRIDSNRIYTTGLSAGGASSFWSVTRGDAVSKLITSAVVMSPAVPFPYDLSMISKYKIETWFLSGDQDASYTPNATNFYNQCNSFYPNSSKLTIYSGGHCCWNTYYDKNWHDPNSGLSIWQWFLTNKRLELTTLPIRFKSIKLKRS